MLARLACLCTLLFVAIPAQAEEACFLLLDPAEGRVLKRQGPDCAEPVSPASSFKVPLALMGFDSGILVDAHNPVWPYREEYDAWREAWKQPIDPTLWEKESVVWYSQELTRHLGAERFAAYVAAFDYGNRDLSGNPGRDDGLTQAWLSSSLRISPDEQGRFLARLLNRDLGVSDHAYEATLAVLPRFPLEAGWTAAGKTGTGFLAAADGTADRGRPFGWFVGWAERDGRRIVFVRLIKDAAPQETPAGPRARDEALAALPALLRDIAP